MSQDSHIWEARWPLIVADTQVLSSRLEDVMVDSISGTARQKY